MGIDLFTIGKHHDKSYSAIKIFFDEEYESRLDISENNFCYYVTDIAFDINGRVLKDTKQGRTISKLIESNDLYTLEGYITKLCLKYTNVHDIRITLNNMLADASKRGRQLHQAEIRKSLGLC